VSSPARPASPLARDVALLAALVALVATMASYTHVVHDLSIVDSAAAATAGPDCTHGEDEARISCLQHQISMTLYAGGDLAGALEQINERAQHDELLAARCHMLLHEEGRRWPGRLEPGSIRHDGKDCAAGFLHGWMLAHLGRAGRLDRATVDAWCAPTGSPLGRADCEHGMGHVLVRNLRGDLATALARCRGLGSDARVRNCAGGAFMENRAGGRAQDDAAPTRSWRLDDPWAPCAQGVDRDLLDVCAAWAVRDVIAGERRTFCATLPAGVDARPCRVAIGAIAPSERSGPATCADDTDCWFGRGYVWSRTGDVERCALGGSTSEAGACRAGVAFRRAAQRTGGATVAIAWA
jgi:hypothetical protein